MMITLEFRLVNAKEKCGADNLQCLNKEITNVKDEIKPKVNQCIAANGHIIIEADYHPDGIITYKVPKKPTDYEFYKIPEEYREEVIKLQKELNLTKKQVNELYKLIKSLDTQIDNLERKLELLRDNAKQLKSHKNMEKQINDFFKTYEKFSECLTSNLASFDPETKCLIKKELIKLIQHVEDVIEKYLT